MTAAADPAAPGVPDSSPPTRVHRFGDVEVDPQLLQVRVAGEVVRTEPQVFDVLRYLIEQRHRVVTKEELLDAVWGDRFVSESALTSRIKDARRAVGDDGRRQEIIRTVHGRGYQFVADLDEVDGTSLPAAETPLSSVPAATRPLIARAEELDDVIELLGANRLVTVVGPGGVGKTRLAMEVARRWDYDRDDRVVFVPLATVVDPDSVGSAIRVALGVNQGDRGDAVNAVREALKGRPCLLVLDNFEHVVAAADVVMEILETTPTARCLVTSRERLRLSHEQTYELDPLGLIPDPGSGAEPAAISFFCQAARTAIPDFELTDAVTADVQAICSMLDGLPLAIELAAAQLRYFPLPYLRTHLEARTIRVSDDSRDRPERQRSVWDTVAWSHALLTAPQQALFAKLSVFVGGWSFAGAAAVSDLDHDRTLEALKALLDKSLVERATSPSPEPRFTMLHLIREFAGAQLEDAGHGARTRDDHARHVTEFAEAVDAARWPANPDRYVDDLNTERGNIAAALEWSFGDGDPLIGCRLVAALNLWWFRTGRHNDGRRWAERALGCGQDLDDDTRAMIHLAAGYVIWAHRDLVSSATHWSTAAALAQSTGNDRIEALSLCSLAMCTIGDPDRFAEARAMAQRGLALAEAAGETHALALGLNFFGELVRSNGEYREAEELYRRARDLNRHMGDKYSEAICEANIGHAIIARGDAEGAIPYYRTAMELSSRVNSRVMMAWGVSESALPCLMRGRAEIGAVLVGASETALGLLGATLTPADAAVHRRTVERLVDELGRDRFDQLIDEGAGMTLEDAVELALGQL